MAYEVTNLVPGETATFEPGTSLLVSGSTQAGRERLFDVLADPALGFLADEGSLIVISADLSARQVVNELRERDGSGVGRVGVIDCTDGTDSDQIDDQHVVDLSSPSDLTGISLEFAKLVRRFREEGRGDRVGVGVASVSTLLMYAELRTVFRFLHVFTSRIGSAGMFGVFLLDPEMHDGQTRNTVRAIFDCEARLDGTDVTLQGSGYSIAPTE